MHTKIEQDQLPKPSRNLDVMLSATSKKIKNAVQRLNTAINKHSAYIDLDHNFKKIQFENEQSVLFRLDVEYKMPPAALMISYHQAKGNIDIYVSKTNPVPTESDCDLNIICRRPHSLTITGERG